MSPKLPLEEVLFSFSAEPSHDRVTLGKYLQSYPEYSEELVDLSIELLILPARETKVVDLPNAAVDYALARFHSKVKGLSESTASKVVSNPFHGMDSGKFQSLAQQLDINSLFLTYFRDRTIDFTSIPQRFVAKLAEGLEISIDTIKEHLCAPPVVSSSQSFKSDHKPEAKAKIMFDQALEKARLSIAQKEALKKLKD